METVYLLLTVLLAVSGEPVKLKGIKTRTLKNVIKGTCS